MATAARYLPHRAFPPYTYVPGQAPHPLRDPAGHMFTEQPAAAELLIEEWWNCEEYLWGIDLFNYGYYWEAHEAWEGLWHSAGRSGPVADFLKGLIKLAAAGVKTREGSPSGRLRHLHRANELLGKSRQDFGIRFMGLDLDAILSAIGEADFEVIPQRDSVPEVVFPFHLVPEQIA